MNEWNIPALLDALNKSADMALHYWNIIEISVKGDGSLVTQADKAIEDYLTEVLVNEEKGSYLLGEETLNSQSEETIKKAFENVAWIVDPIDGTSPYSSGLPHWGVSLGFMEKGKLTNGAVYLVPLGELFITHGADILYAKVPVGTPIQMKDLHPLKIKRAPITSSSILSFSRVWNKKDLTKLRNPIHSTGSSVFALSKILQGCYLGIVTRFYLWDGAGCFPMLERAGYLCEFLHTGEKLTLDVSEENYTLEKGAPSRWMLKDAILISGSKESITFVREEAIRAELLLKP